MGHVFQPAAHRLGSSRSRVTPNEEGTTSVTPTPSAPSLSVTPVTAGYSASIPTERFYNTRQFPSSSVSPSPPDGVSSSSPSPSSRNESISPGFACRSFNLPIQADLSHSRPLSLFLQPDLNLKNDRHTALFLCPLSCLMSGVSCLDSDLLQVSLHPPSPKPIINFSAIQCSSVLYQSTIFLNRGSGIGPRCGLRNSRVLSKASSSEFALNTSGPKQ